MQADHQDFQRPRRGETGRAFAEEPYEFVVDDFDDLLAGGDPLEDFLADALRLYALDEFARDLEMHVGGEEGGAHFLECVRHVFVGEFADASEIAERAAEFFGEGFEHGTPPLADFPPRCNSATRRRPRVRPPDPRAVRLGRAWRARSPRCRASR